MVKWWAFVSSVPVKRAGKSEPSFPPRLTLSLRLAGEWMYLTVCPPCAPGHDSSVGELMHLTVCPLHGPGHGSSVGKWMYLLVCPPRAPGHDSSVGELMHLTVCPLHGPGHDSSVRELMYLTVCPLHGPGHGSSVGEWMYLLVCPPCAPGHDSSVGELMHLTVLSMARVMIAQWENDITSLSVLSMTGFNSRPRQSISRDFPLADHMCWLVYSSGSTKERSGAPL